MISNDRYLNISFTLSKIEISLFRKRLRDRKIFGNHSILLFIYSPFSFVFLQFLLIFVVFFSFEIYIISLLQTIIDHSNVVSPFFSEKIYLFFHNLPATNPKLIN